MSITKTYIHRHIHTYIHTHIHHFVFFYSFSMYICIYITEREILLERRYMVEREISRVLKKRGKKQKSEEIDIMKKKKIKEKESHELKKKKRHLKRSHTTDLSHPFYTSTRVLVTSAGFSLYSRYPSFPSGTCNFLPCSVSPKTPPSGFALSTLAVSS